MPYCKKCGRKLKPDQRFCPNCGTEVLRPPVKPSERLPKPGKKLAVPLVVGLVLIVAAVCMMVGYHFLILSPEGEGEVPPPWSENENIPLPPIEPEAEVAFEAGDVIYIIMTDRFYDGDPTNNDQGAGEYRPDNLLWYQGGDWRGIIQKLDYLEDLGVDAIMISPVVRNKWVDIDLDGEIEKASYHGFWAKDYYSTDPHFGTIDDLKELVREAEEKGIATVLDAIPNHCANFLKPANNWKYVGDERPAPPFDNEEWYHREGNQTGDWGNVYKNLNYDLWGLDDFAQEKKVVENALNAAHRYWIEETGAHGYRFDAAKHVPGWYLKSFQDAVGVPTFGEAWFGAPEDLAPYQENLWGVEDFGLYYAMLGVFVDGNSFQEIHNVFNKDTLYRNPRQLVIFLETLDTNRFLTECGGDMDKARLAFTFLLTVRGTPMLFYGTEQGMTGVADKTKDVHRRMMIGWDKSKLLYKLIQKLCRIRHEHPVLRTGEQIELGWGADFYSFGRSLGTKENEVVVVFNNSQSGKMETVDLSPLHFEDGDVLVNLLEEGDQVTVDADLTIEVALDPMEAKIYVLA